MWQSINTFYLNKDWQYSNPIQGEIFRVKSYYIGNFNNQYLKGVIASIFVDNEQIINLVESRRLSYRLEPEIFTFYFPPGLGNQRIGVKRLDSTNLDWFIEIEVFQSENPIEDFENYLISRFGQSLGDIMAIYSRNAISDLIPNSARVNLQRNVATKVIDRNPTRRSLTIYGGNAPVLVFGRLGENNRPEQVLITVMPNEAWVLPTAANGSIYMGDIFFLSSSETSPSFLEQNAVQ